MRHPVTPCTITTTAVVKGRRTLPILIAPFTSTYFLKAMVAAVKQVIQTVLFASYKCYKNCTVLILEVGIKLVYFSTLFGTWQLGKIDVLVNFIIQKFATLKSLHFSQFFL